MKVLPRGNGVATHDHLLILDSSIVELERVELSSKRGIDPLSTCLSLPSFSCCGKTRATNRNLIP